MKNLKLITVLITLFFITNNLYGQGVYTYVPKNFMQLGQGFDKNDPTVMMSFLQAFDTAGTKNTGVEKLDFEIKAIQSVQELQDMLHFDAKIGVRTLGYNVSASTSIDRNKTFKENSISIVITVRLLYNAWSIVENDKLIFVPVAHKHIKTNPSVENLQKSSGTDYVNAIKKGALIYIIATIHDVSSTEKNAISVSAQGSGGAMGAKIKGEASLTKLIAEASANKKLDFTSHCIGGADLISSADLLSSIVNGEKTLEAIVDDFAEYLGKININDLPAFEYNTNSTARFIDGTSIPDKKTTRLKRINDEYISVDKRIYMLQNLVGYDATDPRRFLITPELRGMLIDLKSEYTTYRNELELAFDDCLYDPCAQTPQTCCVFNRRIIEADEILSQIPSAVIYAFELPSDKLEKNNQDIFPPRHFTEKIPGAPVIIKCYLPALIINPGTCGSWSFQPKLCLGRQTDCPTLFNDSYTASDVDRPFMVKYTNIDSIGNLDVEIKSYATGCSTNTDPSVKYPKGSYIVVEYNF